VIGFFLEKRVRVLPPSVAAWHEEGSGMDINGISGSCDITCEPGFKMGSCFLRSTHTYTQTSWVAPGLDACKLDKV